MRADGATILTLLALLFRATLPCAVVNACLTRTNQPDGGEEIRRGCRHARDIAKRGCARRQILRSDLLAAAQHARPDDECAESLVRAHRHRLRARPAFLSRLLRSWRLTEPEGSSRRAPAPRRLTIAIGDHPAILFYCEIDRLLSRIRAVWSRTRCRQGAGLPVETALPRRVRRRDACILEESWAAGPSMRVDLDVLQ